VIYSTLGPLMCAGEEAGARYIIVGFELLPFDGMKSPTLSVLTLNALHWLFRDLSPSGNASELSARLLTSGAHVTQLVPESKNSSPGDPAELLRRPGIFKLSATSGGTTKDDLIAINSLSDEESDLVGERSFTVPPLAGRAPSEDAEDLPLHGYLAGLALLVLCLDLARRLRRRAQWGTV
jgi:hypothetical protein